MKEHGAANPLVSNVKSVITPPCEIQEQVVSTSKQEDQGKLGKGNDSGAVGHISTQLYRCIIRPEYIVTEEAVVRYQYKHIDEQKDADSNRLDASGYSDPNTQYEFRTAV